MTIDEFNKTRWGAGMKCRVIEDGEVYNITSVNFSEALVGLDWYGDINDLDWYRCESVELVD